MALVDGFGVATMQWAQTGGMDNITVTHGFLDAATLTPNETAELISGYWTQTGAPCEAAGMTVGWTFVGVSVLIQNGGALEAGNYQALIAGTATDVNFPIPAYTPLCVTKYTGGAGVAFRGRMYPPATVFDSEGVSPMGALDSGGLTQIRDRYITTFNEWSEGDYPPYLLHGPPLVGTQPAPSLVTSWLVQGNVATQRRRKNRA
jgi:hypothetical protein